MTKTNAPRRDIHESITSSIVRAIGKGAGSYEMPWHRSKVGVMPKNPIGKYRYHGINVLALWCEQEERGFSTPLWATYRQWQSKGAQVRKGERGTLSVFMKSYAKDVTNELGETETVARHVARGACVFNADQVDGFTVDTETPLPAVAERLEGAETFVADTGAVIRHGGDRAFYSPSTDSVQMPLREAFKDTSTRTATESYYSVLCHELTHWTGNEKRCAREFGKRFGDERYAVEELCAELGAAFLCADLGITNEPRPDHAQYLQSWLDVLENDNRAIFTAASKAQAATDYLHSLQRATAQAA